ncbi:sugar phosphate isomerase/epimerase family protein [Stackebrandtia soli]|uniref:sugar phosphate isomerase/epimerase family protein n=1 Tax=Stackebrandtia soli TaxID=1892856 RepID=UPI0039E9E48B
MPDNSSPQRYSVQLYSVRDALLNDPVDTFTRIAELGFTQVEAYGIVEHHDAIQAGQEATGLAIPTAHAGLFGVDHAEVFDAAESLGVELVIAPFSEPELWDNAEDIQNLAEELNLLVPEASRRGLRVGYHNHWWEAHSRVNGRCGLEQFADLLDPQVALEIDTYWATAGGMTAPTLLRRLGDRVTALHIKDGSLAHDASGQVPAGQGLVPIADVLASAPDALRVIEFDHHDGDLMEAIGKSLRFVTEVDT